MPSGFPVISNCLRLPMVYNPLCAFGIGRCRLRPTNQRCEISPISVQFIAAPILTNVFLAQNSRAAANTPLTGVPRPVHSLNGPPRPALHIPRPLIARPPLGSAIFHQPRPLRTIHHVIDRRPLRNGTSSGRGFIGVEAHPHRRAFTMSVSIRSPSDRSRLINRHRAWPCLLTFATSRGPLRRPLTT